MEQQILKKTNSNGYQGNNNYNGQALKGYNYNKELKNKVIEKSGIIFPELNMTLFNRWKESTMDEFSFGSWVDAYQWFKKTKHSYRFLYPQWIKTDGVESLRFKHIKSEIIISKSNNLQ